MYLFTKPNAERIRNIIESQIAARLHVFVGWCHEERRPPRRIRRGPQPHSSGAGQATFDAAKLALCQWQHYRFDWIELHRPDVDPEPEQTVGVLARAVGLWVLNLCRVV